MPELFIILLYIVSGLVMLYFGADWLVKGAVTLALHLGLSPLIVGLTVVALGTSVPEALVSVQAAIGHQGGIALGNVVGSNILNIALILGLSALIRPLKVDSRLVKADVPLLVGSSFMMVVLMEDFHISRMEGAFLLLCVVGYVAGNIMSVGRFQQNFEAGYWFFNLGNYYFRIWCQFSSNRRGRPRQTFRTERGSDRTDHCFHRYRDSGIGYRSNGGLQENTGPCHRQRSRLKPFQHHVCAWPRGTCCSA